MSTGGPVVRGKVPRSFRASARPKVGDPRNFYKMCTMADGVDPGAEALHAAVRAGDLEQVRCLAEAGVPVDAPNRFGRTPLADIEYLDAEPMVRQLLRLGANPQPPHPKGSVTSWSPLHSAAARGYRGIVEVLLDHGCPVDCHDLRGSTPLMSTAIAGQTRIGMYLVERGAQVDAMDPDGRSALSSSAGNPPFFRFLLERIGLARAQEMHPDLLHTAVFVRSAANVQLLLEAGAPWRVPGRPHRYLVLEARADMGWGQKVDQLEAIEAALVRAGSPTVEEAALLAVVYTQRRACTRDLPHCLRSEEPAWTFWGRGRSRRSVAAYRRRLLAAVELHEAGWGDGPDMLAPLLGFPAPYVAWAAGALARWPFG